MNQGTEKINKDIVTGGGSGGDSSLIYGQFALCTSELICLLLYGYANGNVGAYDSTGNKIETAEQVDIGLLSMDECRHGIQVSDKLKRPKLPIFLLHGIDHVTLMFDPTLTGIDTPQRQRMTTDRESDLTYLYFQSKKTILQTMKDRISSPSFFQSEPCPVLL